MKLHIVVIATAIFLVALLIFGLRGLDAAVCSVLTFLAGVRVGNKEQAVIAYIDGLKSKAEQSLSKLFNS